MVINNHGLVFKTVTLEIYQSTPLYLPTLRKTLQWYSAHPGALRTLPTTPNWADTILPLLHEFTYWLLLRSINTPTAHC